MAPGPAMLHARLLLLRHTAQQVSPGPFCTSLTRVSREHRSTPSHVEDLPTQQLREAAEAWRVTRFCAFLLPRVGTPLLCLPQPHKGRQPALPHPICSPVTSSSWAGNRQHHSLWSGSSGPRSRLALGSLHEPHLPDTALQDHDFLEEERIFLQTLKGAHSA